MQTATPAGDETCAFDGKIETWVDDECAACVFKDVRLKRRFVALMKSIARIIGGSIPFVCQDWANTKAAASLAQCPLTEVLRSRSSRYATVGCLKATMSAISALRRSSC